MIKNRVIIWSLTLVTCLCISGLFTMFRSCSQTTGELYVKVDINSDKEILEILSNKKIKGKRIILRLEDPDVIISDKTNEEISGYTKYENKLSSPLVMYVNTNINSYSDGFTEISDYKYKVDLKKILNSMLNDTCTWSELGFNEKVITGDVCLYIPDEQNAYYTEVIDLFYLTLNNGKMPNEEEKILLKESVDKILSKCIKVGNIEQSIKDEYNYNKNKFNGDSNRKIFIGPEFLYNRKTCNCSYFSNNNSSSSYKPVYFNNTINMYNNIYIKNNEENDFDFINVITKNDYFYKYSGWRVDGSNYDLGSAQIKNP